MASKSDKSSEEPTKPQKPRASRYSWPAIVERAAEIVHGYGDLGVTLRQCFYRLISEGVIRNETYAYKKLSERTAEARRDGWFPSFIDLGRHIDRDLSFKDPANAMRSLAATYRRDRTEGQEYAIWIGVEKQTFLGQLERWFGDLGLPRVAASGYPSQTLLDDIVRNVREDGRRTILIYGQDFDASGVDIKRDFIHRTHDVWDQVITVGVLPEHIQEYALIENPAKETDKRLPAFIEMYGLAIQVELEALAPEDLKMLYQHAIDQFFDYDAYQRVRDQEEADRQEIISLIDPPEVSE